MSINKVILIGNVGADPEVKYIENDRAVANLRVATSERGFTTQAGKEIPERTEWHSIVLWGGLAKVAENYVKKGTKVYIEGKLRTRTWDDKDGNKRYTTEIYGDNLELLSSRGSESTAPANSHNAANTKQNTSPASNDDISDNSEDDLPF